VILVDTVHDDALISPARRQRVSSEPSEKLLSPPG